MSINKTFNSTPSGFKKEGGAGRVADSKIYIGFVKNVIDQQRMGRLEVYIPELGGDPANNTHWYIASYASPFAGVSDPANMQANSHTYDGSQQSYGWWMVPPDTGNQVLVTFVNGDPNKCFWFACLYQQNMNHMVPGVAQDVSYENNADGSLPPVVEYNRKDPSVNVGNPVRPRFDPLALGLQKQGLTQDFERGGTSASARREAPSRVFGYLTPRANQVYVDDNPDNEFIRLRTRSGTQVLVHETNGYVYINSGLGNSWIEVSDAGVDVYTKGSISMHAEQDFNVRADRNIIMDAGNNVIMTAGNNINLSSGNDTTSLAGSNIRFNAASGEFTVNTGSNANITATGSMTLKSGDTHNRSAPQILDNVSTPPDAPTVSKPATVAQVTGSGTIDSTVSRMPNHEPWNGHPKSKSGTPPSGESAGSFTPDPNNNTPAFTPNKGTTSQPIPVQTPTGDGGTKAVPPAPYNGPTIKVSNVNIRADVLAAIKKAAAVTNVDIGILMAMCYIESTFNPTAKAGTSSAYGLYQFTDGSWSDVVKKHGKELNVTQDMRSDVNAQALMGAAFCADNAASIQKTFGRTPSATDVYIYHFMGAGGGKNFLKNLANTPDAIAASLYPSAAAANPSIFGGGKTIQQIYANFQSKMEPRASAYASLANSSTTA